MGTTGMPSSRSRSSSSGCQSGPDEACPSAERTVKTIFSGRRVCASADAGARPRATTESARAAARRVRMRLMPWRSIRRSGVRKRTRVWRAAIRRRGRSVGSWQDLAPGARPLEFAFGVGGRGCVASPSRRGQRLARGHLADRIEVVVVGGAEARIPQAGENATLSLGVGAGALPVGEEEAADLLLKGWVEIAAEQD